MSWIKNLFLGRIGRENFILGIILVVIFGASVFTIYSIIPNSLISDLALLVLLILALLLGIALCVRRIHDIGQSAYWLLLLLISGVNVILLIYLAAKKEQVAINKYGAIDPEDEGLFYDIFNLR